MFPQADTQRMWYWTRCLKHALGRAMKVPQCLLLLYHGPRDDNGTRTPIDDPEAAEPVDTERLPIPRSAGTRRQEDESRPHFLVDIIGPAEFLGNSAQEAASRRWKKGLYYSDSAAEQWGEAWWYHFNRNSFRWDVSALRSLQSAAYERCTFKREQAIANAAGIELSSRDGSPEGRDSWIHSRVDAQHGKLRREFTAILRRTDVMDSIGDAGSRLVLETLFTSMLRFYDESFANYEVAESDSEGQDVRASLFKPYCPIAYDLCFSLTDFARNLPDSRISLVFIIYDILAASVSRLPQNAPELAPRNAEQLVRTKVFPPVLRSLWRALTDRLLAQIPRTVDRSRVPMCLSDQYIVSLDYQNHFVEDFFDEDERNERDFVYPEHFESDVVQGWNFVDCNPFNEKRTKILVSRASDWRDCLFLVDWARVETERKHVFARVQHEKAALQRAWERDSVGAAGRSGSGIESRGDAGEGDGGMKRKRVELEQNGAGGDGEGSS